MNLDIAIVFDSVTWPVPLGAAAACRFLPQMVGLDLTAPVCNEHGTIYAISSDFSDRMTTQSIGLMLLLSEHF